MKRIVLATVAALLCLCMAGCSSSSPTPSQSGSPSSSSSSNDTLNVGEDVEISGSIIQVTNDFFVVDSSGVHFTCIPADANSLKYITAGNVLEVEGVIESIGDSAITLQNVTIDDFSDGYKNLGDHDEHHSDDHHD